MIVLANATALKYFGKLGDEAFVIANLGVIAGHHAADLISAWRGNK
jgi:hypothetical protein